MEVRIIRSRRRRRTISGHIVKDILVVHAPFWISEERLGKIVANFKLRFERKKLKAEINRKQDLTEVVRAINERYFNNELKINSIEYVTDQSAKFGCCNHRTASIRISHKVSLLPRWVRNYVVLHEMAHLIEPNHSRSFWDIVSRYRLAERARGFLMAAGSRDD